MHIAHLGMFIDDNIRRVLRINKQSWGSKVQNAKKWVKKYNANGTSFGQHPDTSSREPLRFCCCESVNILVKDALKSLLVDRQRIPDSRVICWQKINCLWKVLRGPPYRDRSHCVPWKISIAASSLVKGTRQVRLDSSSFDYLSNRVLFLIPSFSFLKIKTRLDYLLSLGNISFFGYPSSHPRVPLSLVLCFQSISLNSVSRVSMGHLYFCQTNVDFFFSFCQTNVFFFSFYRTNVASRLQLLFHLQGFWRSTNSSRFHVLPFVSFFSLFAIEPRR